MVGVHFLWFKMSWQMLAEDSCSKCMAKRSLTAGNIERQREKQMAGQGEVKAESPFIFDGQLDMQLHSCTSI